MRYLALILMLLLPVAANAADRPPNGDVMVQGYHCYTVYRHIDTPRQRIIKDTCNVAAILKRRTLSVSAMDFVMFCQTAM
ncbi:hypothetical protein AB7M49_001583 [Bradyrhizobium elkanii]